MQILNKVRKTSRNFAGNRALFFLRFSFLLSIGLWFYGFYEATDTFGDVIVDLIVAVILGAITFEFVAAGLAICLIPFVILYRMFADALRNSDG
jgi:hypothetical protein